MKFWYSVVLAYGISASVYGEGFDSTHSVFSALLQKHVVAGEVDYAALHKKPAELVKYVESLSSVSEKAFNGWRRDDQIAYLVNLYNAATLQLILDHYPVKSIRKIGSVLKSPWDLPIVTLHGKQLSLNNVEHDILRKQYDEPRLHMALVCAAKSCPPLRSEAYTGELLDQQLHDQAKVYIASDAGAMIDVDANRVSVSAIFKWYGGDFVKAHAAHLPKGHHSDSERGTLGFVSRYVEETDRNFILRGNYRVRYLDYDWSLNEQ
jgi:hypothetical protein